MPGPERVDEATQRPPTGQEGARVPDDPVLLALAQAARHVSPTDPAVTALRGAEVSYREIHARLALQTASLQRSQRDLADAQARAVWLEHELAEAQRLLDRERQRAARDSERAAALASAIGEIHRGLFGGNVHELILKACLVATGATRGLYLTARGTHDTPRVRAAVGMDAVSPSPPSPFLQALCRAALAREDTFVANSPAELADLDARPGPGEDFQSVIAAPVVLLADLNGVVVAADKASGTFDERDAKELLGVGDHAQVATQNAVLRREVQQAYLSTVAVLADALAARDPDGQGRGDLVLRTAQRAGERLGLSAYDRSVVYYTALLHDIGNIGVGDGVLTKPGPLRATERALVQSHVRIGHDLVRHLPALAAVADAVLRHHEWYDGGGYPDGLVGESIPVAARVVGVVTAYYAMTTRRGYREPYGDGRARDELRRNAGTQFDPRVVEAVLAVLDEPLAQTEREDIDEVDADGLLPDFDARRGALQSAGAAR